MKFIVFYFSGTGNTALLARELATALQGEGRVAMALDIEKIADFNAACLRVDVIAEALLEAGVESDGSTASLLDGCVFGFAFPVYKLSYPRIVDRFLECLVKDLSCPGDKDRSDRLLPAFTLSTCCRFPGSALRDASVALARNGFAACMERSFKCPSNGICSLKTPGESLYDNVMFFENAIGSTIGGYARELVEAFVVPSVQSRMDTWRPPRARALDAKRVAFVGLIEQARYPRITIDTDRCSVCGLCSRSCPEQNLPIEGGRIHIVDDEGCLHCLRCLHRCPQKAVSFGPLVQGPGRYTRSIRDKLYAEANTRTKEAPEPAAPLAKYVWATGTALSSLGPIIVSQCRAGRRRNPT